MSLSVLLFCLGCYITLLLLLLYVRLSIALAKIKLGLVYSVSAAAIKPTTTTKWAGGRKPKRVFQPDREEKKESPTTS